MANTFIFFAEKMWVAFTFFQQKISEYCILNQLKQLAKWPITSIAKAIHIFATVNKFVINKH